MSIRRRGKRQQAQGPPGVFCDNQVKNALRAFFGLLCFLYTSLEWHGFQSKGSTKMRRHISLFFASTLSFCFFSCSGPTDAILSGYATLSKGNELQKISRNESDVLNAFFAYRLGGVSDEIVMIYDYSFSYAIPSAVVQCDNNYPRHLINKFNELNSSSHYVGSQCLAIESDYRYFDRKTLMEQLASTEVPDDFWLNFNKVYPQSPSGYFQISKIAFNDDSTHALFCMMNFWGPLQGDGGYFAFKNRCGKWSVVDYTVIWKS